MNILKDGLPDMKMNFLYSTVFDPRYEKIVQIFDGRLVGGMCIKSEPQQYAKIQYMVVSSRFRKRGFGTLLINVLKSKFFIT